MHAHQQLDETTITPSKRKTPSSAQRPLPTLTVFRSRRTESRSVQVTWHFVDRIGSPPWKQFDSGWDIASSSQDYLFAAESDFWLQGFLCWDDLPCDLQLPPRVYLYPGSRKVTSQLPKLVSSTSMIVVIFVELALEDIIKPRFTAGKGIRG